MTENIENSSPLSEPDEEPVILQKPKRQLTEKQKEATARNLAKGREKLQEKKRQQKEEANALKEQLIVKKAARITKQKVNQEKQLKTILDIHDDEPDEIEERIIKKPKKKKIIYREESDSEEEVIIKPKPKMAASAPVVKPDLFRINFC